MPDEYEYLSGPRHPSHYIEEVELGLEHGAVQEPPERLAPPPAAGSRRGRRRDTNPYEAKIRATIPQPAQWPSGGKPPGGPPRGPDEPPIKTWITDVGNRIGELTEAIKSVGRKIEGLGGRLDRLEMRVGDIERTLWDHERRLDELEEEVSLPATAVQEEKPPVAVPPGAGIAADEQKLRHQSKK